MLLLAPVFVFFLIKFVCPAEMASLEIEDRKLSLHMLLFRFQFGTKDAQ